MDSFCLVRFARYSDGAIRAMKLCQSYRGGTSQPLSGQFQLTFVAAPEPDIGAAAERQ